MTRLNAFNIFVQLHLRKKWRNWGRNRK